MIEWRELKLQKKFLLKQRQQKELLVESKLDRLASVTGGISKTVPPDPLNIIPPRIVTSNSHGQYTRKQILRFWGPCMKSKVAHWVLSADATT